MSTAVAILAAGRSSRLGQPKALVTWQGRSLLQRALDTYIESAHRSTAWSRLVVKYFGAAAIEVLKQARAQ